MKDKVILTEEMNRMRNLFGYKAGKVISEQLANKQNQSNSPFPAYKTGPNSKVANPVRPDTKPNQSYSDSPFPAYKTGPNSKVANPVRPDTKPDQSYPNLPFPTYKTTDKTVVAPVTPDTKPVAPKVSTPIQTPKQLGSIEGVKKFQEWLNTNNPGWLKGKTIPLDAKKGYGKFGPSTSASWNKLKDTYLKDVSGLKSSQKMITNPELASTTVAPAQGAKIGQSVSTNTDQAGLTATQQYNLKRIGQQLQTPEQKRAADLAQRYGS